MTAITVWSDIGCPWACLAVHRLWQARDRLGLADAVRFDHRAFALEIVNDRPTPKRILDAETVAIGSLEPAAGWQLWTAPSEQYPVSTLLALEAVQAAKQQSLVASEALDRALRQAFFAESRCVSMRHVVVAVAAATPAVDAGRLEGDLDTGSARAAVLEQHRYATRDGSEVRGSPHVFLPDGSGAHNPGVTMHWVGQKPGGYPVIDSDDPSVYEALLRQATSLS